MITTVVIMKLSKLFTNISLMIEVSERNKKILTSPQTMTIEKKVVITNRIKEK